MSNNNKKSFEDLIKRLEEISNSLDSDDIELDESISLYEEGINISKDCFTKLKSAELKISVLKKDLDGIIQENNFEE